MEFKELLELRKIYHETHQIRTSLQEAESNLLKKLRENCSHPDRYIAEAPYEPADDLSDAKSPFRICEVCGLSEKKWGHGYKLLRDKRTYNLSRDEADKLRLALNEIK